VLNRGESTEFSRAITVIQTQEYPITLPVIGTGQMLRINARCLPIKLLNYKLGVTCVTNGHEL